MSTLANRLDEICVDLQIPLTRGKATALQALLGVSSGRVSQIYADGERAKLGAEAIAKLAERGYSPEWVLTGKGPRKTGHATAGAPAPPLSQAVVRDSVCVAEIMRALESVLAMARVPMETVAYPDRAALEARLTEALKTPLKAKPEPSRKAKVWLPPPLAPYEAEPLTEMVERKVREAMEREREERNKQTSKKKA